MKMTEDKIYHIYLNGECEYHSLKPEEFRYVWALMKHIQRVVNPEMKIEYVELGQEQKSLSPSY